MRRLAALICWCLALLVLALTVSVATASARAETPAHSWATPQIKLVTKAGIFQSTPATFDPAGPLTAGALSDAVGRLTGRPGMTVDDRQAPVSIAALDASLVRALGLSDSAAFFYRGASEAGLSPPPRFGTESVARLLRLRVDHPVGQDDLEVQPDQTATRAEAAYSFARVLRLDANGPDDSRHSTSANLPLPDPAQSWAIASVRSLAQTFTLPQLTGWQRQILTTAVSYIGYPYVWGGTLDTASGFDCSGFVWQVYKLNPYANEGALATVLQGRTTMAMSAEVPRNKRIHYAALQPGDVLFFGSGPRSKAAQIDHAAIYLGNGWYINSSGQGVAIARLGDWSRSSFAWARRPLAEAGLE